MRVYEKRDLVSCERLSRNINFEICRELYGDVLPLDQAELSLPERFELIEALEGAKQPLSERL
jgi:hypothetical protein